MQNNNFKTIGLLGGMSWQSTASYYALLNEGIKNTLGGLHSAKILMHSVDFAEIVDHQKSGRWDKTGKLLASAAKGLEQAGADIILICTNTMHANADRISEDLNIPLLHIADATAEAIKANGFKTVSLLGTRFVMEQAFYKDRLWNKHGIKVLVPEAADRDIVHNVIFEELCLGHISDKSRKEYVRIIEDLNKEGAEAAILGCTEIGLLVKPEYTAIPLLDTTAIHCEAAVKWALEENHTPELLAS